MKKQLSKTFLILTLGIAMLMPVFVSAQDAVSTPDYQTIVNQLQAQIQSLRAQIADLKAEVKSVKLELKFSRALAQGATGDDVKQLQEFLKTFTGSYPDGLITGYYGPLTAVAVKKFQVQNGIESVGVVGPKTQAKLNLLATAIPGTPAVPAPGTVMLPAPTSIATGLNVSLASNNPYAGPLSFPMTSEEPPVPVLAMYLTAGSDSAMTVSELKFHEKGVLPDSSILEAYLVENGEILYKYSSISGGVIDFNGLSLSVAAGEMRTVWLVIEISGGLSVGNTVSFSLNTASDVTARDASNNLVTASGSFPVIGNTFTALSVSHLTSGTPDPSTFSQPSQSYYRGEVGPATPAIPAVPGEPATSAIPATPCGTPVGVQIQPEIIKVLSPNGGEQWQISGAYIIKYSVKNIDTNKALLIYLNRGYDAGYDAPTTQTGVKKSIQLIGVTTNLESYTYTVPSTIQSYPGLGSNYTITIMVEGSFSSCGEVSYIGDSSDAEFSIVAGQYSPAISAGSTLPGGTTTIAPSSGGGGYGQEDKTAPLLAQINALQYQLANITDDSTRAMLTAQIIDQEAQLQALQDKISAVSQQVGALKSQVVTTTDVATRDSLLAQITALGAQEPALQDKKNVAIKQISSLHYQFDNTYLVDVTYPLNNAIDEATRATLLAKIAELEAERQALLDKQNALFTQLHALENQLDTTTDATTRASLTAQMTALKGVQMQAISDGIDALLKPIIAVKIQLDNITDASTRTSLRTQITALKAQVQALESN